MSAKQSALSFRIEEAMKIALDQAAAEDWWPTANLCALILENWLRDHNRLLAPKRIFRAEARAAIVNRKLIACCPYRKFYPVGISRRIG
jgi:hypothetical protein